jgi:site-specific DNA-methyltransferase (cytosine-N4-specific)
MLTPWLEDADVRLYHGDVLAVLRELPAESVDCCVTSPPYWGLRDYGTGAWEGGDPDCQHSVGGQVTQTKDRDTMRNGAIVGGVRPGVDASLCRKCGATRIDQQLGLEPTPEEYVTRMVEVFREVRRVLAAHGTVWLNLGDSYAAGKTGRTDGDRNERNVWSGQASRPENQSWTGPTGNERKPPPGYKPKDLVGIPWRVAFALQADGWWLRSAITWCKPNCMPESVTDRPTKATEMVFLLTKAPRYYYDAEAVREKDAGYASGNGFSGRQGGARDTMLDGGEGSPERFQPGAGRNQRDWWFIPTQPYPNAHFATFPEELARRCIAAGCPEQVCRVCGKARERVTQPTAEYGDMLTKRPHAGEFDLPKFNAYVRECREASGLSKAEVGEALGVSGTAVNWWEGGLYMGAPAVRFPEWEIYQQLKSVIGMDERFDEGLRCYRVRIEGEWKQKAENTLVEGNRKGGRSATAQRETLGFTDCDCGKDAPSLSDRNPASSVGVPWDHEKTGKYRSGLTLDPFMGSGTVAHVARKLGRHAIGIDLNESYLELAARRLQQQSLFAGTA